MRSIVVGTAGHIDHGKSSLVLALTGTDPDRLKEEKTRGITIDLGFAHARVGDLDVAFVDVPGHERFVKNMLAGVGGIDAVLLVIAADEAVMPQTREHFAICRLLQIPTGVIALTKVDLVDTDMLELAQAEARELVAGSLIANAPIVPVSSRTGQGLEPLRQALAAMAAGQPARGADGTPRLPIDRVFSMRGFGTVVTGTLTSGTLRVDDDLVLLPGGRRVKVRGVQVHGAQQPSVEAGRRAAVNLGGVDVADISRGQTLTRDGAFDETRRFDAVVELLPEAPPLRHGSRVRFHHGTSEILGRVAVAAKRSTSSSGETTRARDYVQLESGGQAYVRIRLEAPAVLTRGDRFILRQYSPAVTIGGGRVIDPTPVRSPIRTDAARERFEQLDGDVDAATLVFADERKAAGLTLEALARRAGISAGDAATVATRLAASGQVLQAGGELFPMRLATELETGLAKAVGEYHKAQPLSEGLPREEARERLFGRASPALFDAVLARLESAGRVTGRDRLALPGQGVSLSSEEMQAQQALDRVFREGGLAPPDIATAAGAAGIQTAVADRVAKLLLRQKTLVKVDTLFFHHEALTRLKADVKGLKGQGAAKVDVAGFKDRYGISRKYAIPLLEWLDRERVTRRVGDGRIVL